jgi:hypothetical protein
MLQNLLRSAANYDTLELVLQDLSELIKGWETAYGDMAIDPVLRPFTGVWQTRASGTLIMLASMRTRLQNLT